MNLRLRLNLLITALLLLFLLAVGYVIIKGTKSSIQEGVESATRVTTQLLDTVIISSVQNPDWGYTHDVLKRFLQSLGHVRSNDIKLYNMQGVLLYQSPHLNIALIKIRHNGLLICLTHMKSRWRDWFVLGV